MNTAHARRHDAARRHGAALRPGPRRRRPRRRGDAAAVGRWSPSTPTRRGWSASRSTPRSSARRHAGQDGPHRQHGRDRADLRPRHRHRRRRAGRRLLAARRPDRSPCRRASRSSSTSRWTPTPAQMDHTRDAPVAATQLHGRTVGTAHGCGRSRPLARPRRPATSPSARAAILKLRVPLYMAHASGLGDDGRRHHRRPAAPPTGSTTIALPAPTSARARSAPVRLHRHLPDDEMSLSRRSSCRSCRRATRRTRRATRDIQYAGVACGRRTAR